MYNLHHYPLCPLSRLVRVLLIEKQLGFKLIEEKPWLRTAKLAQLNPCLELPILVADNYIICSIYAICEYLNELNTEISFFAESATENAEIRRLLSWFNYKFNHEVSKILLEEKIYSHFFNRREPKANFLRAANVNLKNHFSYLEFLLNSRKWLAGDNLSIADLAAACQISVLDYLGDVNWSKFPLVQEWYAVIKSRPSFRTLLMDRVMGFSPPSYYSNLDF